MKTGRVNQRLYAFYQSKVINALALLMVVTIMSVPFMDSLLLTEICAWIEVSCLAGYSLWFWIKKPAEVVINRWLAEMCRLFFLYCLIVLGMRATNEWWYITPVAMAVLTLFVSLINNKDEKFTIDQSVRDGAEA